MVEGRVTGVIGGDGVCLGVDEYRKAVMEAPVAAEAAAIKARVVLDMVMAMVMRCVESSGHDDEEVTEMEVGEGEVDVSVSCPIHRSCRMTSSPLFSS